MSDQTNQELSDELGPELPVFLRYSRTMLAAQLLEFTVFQPTHLKKKTPQDMERAIRKLEGLLNHHRRTLQSNSISTPTCLQT